MIGIIVCVAASRCVQRIHLKVLANWCDWHPVTLLFVYSICLSLPVLPACLWLGLWVTHLQPWQQSHCKGQFSGNADAWKTEGSSLTGPLYPSFRSEFGFSALHSDVSITVPSSCLYLTVSCNWQWDVLDKSSDNENSTFQAAVPVTHFSMQACCKRTMREA